MTRADLQKLLGEVETARGTAEGAVAQLRNIERRLKDVLDGRSGRSESSHRAAVAPGASNPDVKPDTSWLAAINCPRCNETMLWRWSRANGEWFAGCTAFSAKGGCRGSRSFDNVLRLSEGASNDEGPLDRPVEAGPSDPREELPYSLEDYERIEKHHGPGASDGLDANGDPVIPF